MAFPGGAGNRSGVGDVERDSMLRPCRFLRLVEIVGIEVPENDPAAFGDDAARALQAQARGAAGDDCRTT